MKLLRFGITLFLIMISNTSNATITCPPMPRSVTEVNRDVKSDIKASAASLGKVKAGDVSVKTEVTVKNLFDKYPNVDKLLTLQTMTATYCAMLRDATTLSEKEKIDRWERFQDKVLNMQPTVAQKKKSSKRSTGRSARLDSKETTPQEPASRTYARQQVERWRKEIQAFVSNGGSFNKTGYLESSTYKEMYPFLSRKTIGLINSNHMSLVKDASTVLVYNDVLLALYEELDKIAAK